MGYTTNIMMFILFLILVSYMSFMSRGNNFFLPNKNSNMSLGLSYGATLMSTTSIVGFGGLAGWWGYSIFTVIFFLTITVFFTTRYIGPKIYSLNKKINAKTYIELISKYYKSDTLSILLSLVIFLLVPFYTSAIIISISKFINVFTGINYEFSLILFSITVSITVLIGGMKSVLKNDTLQGIFLIAGSIIILLYTLKIYVIDVDYLFLLKNAWNNSVDPVTMVAKNIGFNGYFSYPTFWSPGWIFLVSLLVFTIPVGMIALPQLQTRFLLAKDESSFKNISWYGLIIPILIASTFFIVGVSANGFYFNEYGKNGISINGIDSLIPSFIADGYPLWIGTILFVTVLSAAFSTINSLLHLMATTISHDLGFKEKGKFIGVIGIIIFSLLIAIIFQKEPAFISRSSTFIFSILGGSMLPVLLGMIFFKNISSKVAITSFTSGTILSIIWIFFFHFKEAKLFGVSNLLFDVSMIYIGRYNFIDTVIFALIGSFSGMYIGKYFDRKL